MRKLIILLLCCGVLVSMVGCGGNTAPPPIESSPITVSETVITETPLVTAVEPTEKEKEPTPTESKEQAKEPTMTVTEPSTTAQPKEQTNPTVIPKPTESSAAKNTESKKETPPKAEEPQEEIYVGIEWPEVDTADIERLVIEKINAYRGYNREAIGMGDWFGTAESMSDRIADGFHHSKGHWAYVGSSKYPYIAVGVTKANGKWYICVCMSEKNYGG